METGWFCRGVQMAFRLLTVHRNVGTVTAIIFLGPKKKKKRKEKRNCLVTELSTPL